MEASVAVLKQLVKAKGGTGGGGGGASTSKISVVSSPSTPFPLAGMSIAKSVEVSGSKNCNDLGNENTTTVDFIWFLSGVISRGSETFIYCHIMILSTLR